MPPCGGFKRPALVKTVPARPLFLYLLVAVHFTALVAVVVSDLRILGADLLILITVTAITAPDQMQQTAMVAKHVLLTSGAGATEVQKRMFPIDTRVVHMLIGADCGHGSIGIDMVNVPALQVILDLAQYAVGV